MPELAKWSGAVVLCLAAIHARAEAGAVTSAGPIIDMHMHTSRGRPEHVEYICAGDEIATFAAVPGPATDVPACNHPLRSAANADDMLRQTLNEFRHYDVRRVVLAPGSVPIIDWTSAAPGIFIPAQEFPGRPAISPSELRQRFAHHGFEVFAEIQNQVAGIRADDVRLEPYWALAEELDVPIGIHLGVSVADPNLTGGMEHFRASLTTPYQLEDVLFRHPKLRIYVMHYSSPLIEEMILMLSTYSSLYVDVAANDWNLPRAQFYGELKRLVDAGFGKHIMFGTDAGPFPQSIGKAILSIENAPFLTAAQKRDILYNNAARFLRLTPEQIAADHRPLKP
jgi:predicted TIM-barrel fold metal-dependent hydrolase